MFSNRITVNKITGWKDWITTAETKFTSQIMLMWPGLISSEIGALFTQKEWLRYCAIATTLAQNKLLAFRVQELTTSEDLSRLVKEALIRHSRAQVQLAEQLGYTRQLVSEGRMPISGSRRDGLCVRIMTGTELDQEGSSQAISVGSFDSKSEIQEHHWTKLPATKLTDFARERSSG